MNCFLIIACLVVGFLLGRLGSNFYDGAIVISEQGDLSIKLKQDFDDLPRCRSVTLRIVKEK